MLEIDSGALSQSTLTGSTTIGATCLVAHLGDLFVGGSLKDANNIERPVVSRAYTNPVSKVTWAYRLENTSGNDATGGYKGVDLMATKYGDSKVMGFSIS